MTACSLRWLLGLVGVACSASSLDRSDDAGGGAEIDAGPVGVDGDSGTSDRVIAGSITHYDYHFDLTTGQATAGFDVAVSLPGGNCDVTDFELPAVSNPTWNGASARSAAVSNHTLQICGDSVFPGGRLPITADVAVPKQTFRQWWRQERGGS